MRNLVEKFTPETEQIDDEGMVMIEYALLGTAIVVIVATVSAAFGPKITTAFTNILP